MKTNKIIKTIFCLALFASSLIATAQDDLGNGNGDVLDTPAAPIDRYLPFLLLIGLIIAFIVYKKSKNKINSL
ncbi:MAG: hypothetical protein ACI9XR_000876 [Flavobacterium sp.]|jgi:H+/Cl- antiporter ClcA